MRKEVQPIAGRLAVADRSLQREKGGSFLFRSIKYFFGLVLVLFLLDIFLHLDATHRILLLAGLGAVMLGALGWACHVAYVRNNPLERVARILEERDPALGSKLINILQIQSQTDDPTLSPLTRQLAQQAVEDYAGRLQQADLQRVARTAELKHAFQQAALAGLIFVAVLAAFFRISMLEILRFADPHGDHPPYSFTRLEITEPLQEGALVVYNQNLLVKVKHAGHRPGEVFLTFFDPQHPESPTTVPMFGKGELGFFQQIEGVKNDLVVFAHTKNHNAYSRKRLVTVLRTPRLDKAFVQISPPAYTGLVEKEKPYQFKNFRALAGSEVKIRLQSNRPLQGGTLEILKSETDIQRLPMAKTGENEVSTAFLVQDTARLRFSLLDIDRLASQEAMEGSVTVTYDLAPDVQITNPTKDSFVSLDYPVVGEIVASDDYGLKTLRVHRALNQVFSPPKTISYDGVKTSARETVLFDFQELGVQSGDVISFFAEAIDTSPTPNLSRSQTINLMLITEDEYNDFLRERSDISDIEGKYADLLNRFQDLIDEQKKIGEKIDELRARLAKADEKEKAALQKELDALLAKQSELNSKLNQMADTMEKFVRKNPVYDVESELQRMLTEKAAQIRASTEANEQKTQDLAKQSNGQTSPRPETLDGFKQASDEQLKKLGAMEREAQEQVAQTLEDMSTLHQLVKGFNQFEELYKMQEALANQAKAYNTSKELSPDDQLALKQMATTEREVRQALEQLAEKLRQDAKAAEQKFPKAAQSASDLADKIEEKRLPPLAGEATGKMLNAEGEPSYQLAEKLRSEMEQLFGECKGQGNQMSDELDSYLKLQKGMNPGNSFRQMMMSRKFGFGSDKGGLGQGKAGLSGFAIMTAPGTDVLGNESRIQKGDARNAPPNPGKEGRPGSKGPGDDLKFDKPDVVKGLTPVNRKSDAVTSESFFEEYGDIIDKYFKSITK